VGRSFVVRGSWFVVRGSWFVVRGSWFVVRGSSHLLVLFKQTQVRISAGEEPVDESTRRWCYRRRANAAEASGGTLSLKSEKIGKNSRRLE